RPGERVAATAISARTEALFDSLMRDTRRPFYVAKWRIGGAFGRAALPSVDWDAPDCSVMRCVLMKPEHETIVDDLISALERWSALV
ncbi:MAG TPA: hypothetical protein VGX02_10560, partial [Candidatus Eremiobacteraceae bacterium]|nr:hypothetical protein [Candidatus Eremiobacteraceae bacterium]